LGIQGEKMSEFKPNELAERRANQENDCRLWTPADALLACLRDLESGEINPERLVIHFTQDVDGNKQYCYYASNITRMEHAGLLSMSLGRIIA
jgi:hypothetical protein